MMRLKALLLIVAGSLMLTGCGFDVYKLPLPGGASVGDNPITITVEFQDVLDLVPKSTVKVNDVSVGQVTDVELDGQSARVTLQVRRDTKLPANAIAEIRQTSLLGEKFVSLSAPPEGASDNLLESGDTIPLDRSGRNPEVEEVLGALSLLLNGGGVAQLKTIAQELNLALEGREDSARSVLDQIRILMTQLDENKGKIVDAIDSLNTLAVSIHKQQGSIDSALEELPSALTSLDKQRNDLVKMLQALNRLGGVGVRVIQASKAATIDTFRQLEPVLTELAASGDDFAKAFNVFLTYPFVDEVVGRDPQVARNLHMGDYTNLSIELDISVDGDTGGPTTLPTNLPTIIDPTVIVDNVLKCIQSGDITSKACQKVLSNAESLAQLR
ncbi:MAG: virulence factor Mce family protein, partial [Nocardioides sp.]|nr:virulence factor Mce family protein [Nocardioides sp.]